MSEKIVLRLVLVLAATIALAAGINAGWVLAQAYFGMR